MGVQGFAHSLVALRGQVKVIIHVLMRDATIRVHEAWVHVEERGVGEGRYGLLDQLVHLGISLPQRVWRFTSGQYTKYKRPGMGELVLDDLDNSHDASTDLFSSLTMIVSAYPQHYNLWADVIQLAVAQSPQHMLCCITTHPKIEGMERREQLPPYPKLMHELNKRVSNKQDIRFFVFAVRHEAVVQRYPSSISLDVFTGSGCGGWVWVFCTHDLALSVLGKQSRRVFGTFSQRKQTDKSTVYSYDC